MIIGINANEVYLEDLDESKFSLEDLPRVDTEKDKRTKLN